jgi:hypothetical protein
MLTAKGPQKEENKKIRAQIWRISVFPFPHGFHFCEISLTTAALAAFAADTPTDTCNRGDMCLRSSRFEAILQITIVVALQIHDLRVCQPRICDGALYYGFQVVAHIFGCGEFGQKRLGENCSGTHVLAWEEDPEANSR